MALQGRPWNACKGDEKKALRVRFDALVADVKSDGSAELDKALDFLGVRRKV
jgi:DNA transformation protein and related proteins